MKVFYNFLFGTDAPIRNGSTKNSHVFGIPYQKKEHSKSFVLVYSVLCQKDKKTKSLRWHELESLGLRGIPLKLNTNPESWMLCFLLSIQKTSFPNLRSSRSRSTTQKSFFPDKNLGRLHVTFVEILQWPKVGSIIRLTTENTKNNVLFAT